MSDSDPAIPGSEVSWGDAFHELSIEYGMGYGVVYDRCQPGSLHQWKATLKISKKEFVGFGHSRKEAKERAMQNGFPWLRLLNESEAKRRSQSSQFGAVRQERGFQNEFAAVRALNDPSFERLDWFQGARRATPDEKARQIDIVVSSDVGPLYLQVKSSRVFAVKFEGKRRATLIGVIIVSHEEDLREINDRAMAKLQELRENVLLRRG